MDEGVIRGLCIARQKRLAKLAEEKVMKSQKIQDKISLRASIAVRKHLLECIEAFPNLAKGYYSADRDWSIEVTPRNEDVLNDFTFYMKDPKHATQKLEALEAVAVSLGFTCKPLDPPDSQIYRGWRVILPLDPVVVEPRPSPSAESGTV
jgi:hypothetical protein